MLARPHVEPADVAARRFLVGDPLVGGDVLDVGADDDHVVDDDRGRVPVELRERADEAEPQVHLARFAETGVPLARTGVDGHELRAQRGEDPRLLAVGPPGDAARLAHSHAVARPGVPEHLPGGRLQRRDGAQAGAEVEHPARHQRGSLRSDRAARGVAVADGVGDDRLPPDDLHVAHVLGVDLVERGVLRARLVGRVGRPFDGLAGRGRGETEHEGRCRSQNAGRYGGQTDSGCDVTHLDLLCRTEVSVPSTRTMGNAVEASVSSGTRSSPRTPGRWCHSISIGSRTSVSPPMTSV